MSFAKKMTKTIDTIEGIKNAIYLKKAGDWK
jgi:hypothetical protein